MVILQDVLVQWLQMYCLKSVGVKPLSSVGILDKIVLTYTTSTGKSKHIESITLIVAPAGCSGVGVCESTISFCEGSMSQCHLYWHDGEGCEKNREVCRALEARQCCVWVGGSGDMGAAGAGPAVLLRLLEMLPSPLSLHGLESIRIEVTRSRTGSSTVQGVLKSVQVLKSVLSSLSSCSLTKDKLVQAGSET